MNVDHLSDIELALRPHRLTNPVMAAFLDAAAIQPAAAMPYRAATAEVRATFDQLVERGVIKPAGRGYWYDLRAHYAAESAKAGGRAVIAVVVALVIVVAAVLSFRG